MPYTPTSWSDGVTGISQTRLNNLETQYTEATNSFEQDLFTAFVFSGLVATKDGSVANKLDVTAGVAFLTQPDSTLRRRAPVASNQTTSTPSATYYLYLQPDGSWYWSTTNSPAANSLWICQVATDGSGNISTVTDKRTINTSLLGSMAGSLAVAGSQYLPLSGGTLTGNLSIGKLEVLPNSGQPEIVFDATAINGESAGTVLIEAINGGTNQVQMHLKNLTGDHSYIDMQTGSVDIYPNGGIACQGLIVNSSATVNSILFGTGGHGGGLSGCTQFSGTNTGTYTHGLNTTPAYVGPMSNANGSQTMGADTYGSSTVHITSAASQAFKAVAIV